GLRVEAVIPDLLEDLRLAHGMAGVAKQELEEGELARLQLDGPARARDLAGHEVERDVAGREAGGVRGVRGAPDQRLHAGEQLRKAERLRQVVVAAAFQAADPVPDRALRAEEE